MTFTEWLRSRSPFSEPTSIVQLHVESDPCLPGSAYSVEQVRAHAREVQHKDRVLDIAAAQYGAHR